MVVRNVKHDAAHSQSDVQTNISIPLDCGDQKDENEISDMSTFVVMHFLSERVRGVICVFKF